MASNCPYCDCLVDKASVECPECGRALTRPAVGLPGEPAVRGTLHLDHLAGAAPPPDPSPSVDEPVTDRAQDPSALGGNSDGLSAAPSPPPTQRELPNRRDPEATTRFGPDAGDLSAADSAKLRAAAATLLLDGEGLGDGPMLSAYWGSAAPGGSSPVSTLQGPSRDRRAFKPLDLPVRTIGEASDQRASDYDYQRVSFVAEGGMGQVFLATQTSIGRHVALKLLKEDPKYSLDEKAQFKEKFLAEAAITGELDHPNILPVHDVGVTDDGQVFYSMKYIKGSSWEDSWQQKSLDENLDILIKVADAVAFAHSKGIVHRDIKPENVMLGPYGEVVVGDWGLAIDLEHDKEFPLSGSVAYAAPEIVTGPCRAIGMHSDVYLLGATLFQLIVGKAPHYFSEDFRDVAHRAARNEILPIPPDKEGSLTSIALRAMATDRVDRYRSVESFQQALRQHQTHLESISVASRAGEELEGARQSQDPNQFARAIFGFEEALGLWRGNDRARRGLRKAQEEFAEHSLASENYEQGLSLLDPDDYSQKELYDRLVKGKTERDSRRRRIRFFRTSAIALLGLVAVIVAASAVVVLGQKRDLVGLRQDVNEAEANLALSMAAERELKQENEDANARRLVAERDLATRESELDKSKVVVARQAKDLAKQEIELQARGLELQEKEAQLLAETEAKQAAASLAQRNRQIAEVSVAASRIDEDDVTFAADTLSNLKAAKGWDVLRLQHRLHADLEPLDGEYDAVGAAGGLLVGARNTAAGVTIRGRSAIATRSPDEQVFETQVNGLIARCIAVDERGEWVAVGGQATAGGRTLLAVLRVTGGSTKIVMRLQNGAPSTRAGINDVAFDKEASRLVVAGRVEKSGWSRIPFFVFQRSGQSWSTDRQAVAGLRPRSGPVDQHKSIGHRVAISPDGQLVAGIATRGLTFDSGGVELWRLGGDSSIQPITPPSLVPTGANDVAVSPTGKRLAVGQANRRVTMWPLSNEGWEYASTESPTAAGAPSLTLVGHDRPVTRVDFVDEDHLVSSGFDRAVLHWNLGATANQAGELVAEPLTRLRGHAASIAECCSAGGALVVSRDDQGKVRLWNLDTYHDQFDAPAAAGATRARVACAANGRVIAIVDNAGGLRCMTGSATDEPGRLVTSRPRYIGHSKSVDPSLLKVGVTLGGEAPQFVTHSGESACLWDAATGVGLDRQKTAGGFSKLATRSAGKNPDVVVYNSLNREWFRVRGDRLERMQEGRVLGTRVANTIALAPTGDALAVSAARYVDLHDSLQTMEHKRLEMVGASRGVTYTPDGDWVLSTSAKRLMRWTNKGENAGEIAYQGTLGFARTPASMAARSVLLHASRTKDSPARTTWLETTPDVRISGESPGELLGADIAPDGTWAVLIPAGRETVGQLHAWRPGKTPQEIQQGGGRKTGYRDVRFLGSDRVVALLREDAKRSAPRSTIAQVLSIDRQGAAREAARIASRSPVLAVTISDDGASAQTFTRAGVIYQWDLTNPAEPRVVSQSHVESLATVTSATVAGDRVYLAQGGKVTCVDRDPRVPHRVLEVPGLVAGAGDRQGLAYLLDGDGKLRVVDGDDTVAEWRVPELQDGPPRFVCCTGTGDYVAVATASRFAMWQRREGAGWSRVVINEDENDNGIPISAIALTPHGKERPRLLIGDDRGGLSVWQLVAQRGDAAADGQVVGTEYTLRPVFGWIGHRHGVESIHFDLVNGAPYAVSTSKQGEASVWPVAAAAASTESEPAGPLAAGG